MSKILEVGDFIYNDRKRPNSRYEVIEVTAKMCTARNKRNNQTVKAKREPDDYGKYNFHGTYGGGYIADEEAEKYYWNFIREDNERIKVEKMRYKLRHDTKWGEVSPEKLEAIINILNQ